MATLVQVKEGSWSDPTSVTLDSTPTQGNLLVVWITERSGGSASNQVISNSGFTVRSAQTISQSSSTYRRSLSVHTKVAGASESATITADDGTGNSKKISAAEFALEAGETDFTFVNSYTNDDGNLYNGTTLSVGPTGSLPADSNKLILFVTGSKGGYTDSTKTLSYTEGVTADYVSSTNYSAMTHYLGHLNTTSDTSLTVTATQTGHTTHIGQMASLLVFNVGSTVSASPSTPSSNSSTYEKLQGLGYTGALTDMKMAYLKDQGYTGSLQDMEAQHLETLGYAGGSLQDELKQKAVSESFLDLPTLRKTQWVIPTT